MATIDEFSVELSQEEFNQRIADMPADSRDKFAKFHEQVSNGNTITVEFEQSTVTKS